MAILPRGVRHDFCKQAQPHNDRAKEAMVDSLVAAVDEDFELIGKVGQVLPRLEVITGN